MAKGVGLVRAVGGVARVWGWRGCARWAAVAAALPLMWACTDRTVVAPQSHPDRTIGSTAPASLVRKLDVLFMIDNSPSMSPLQQKLLDQFPSFMDQLKVIPTGDGAGTALPDIHVAVVSSDTGPGKFLETPGCHFGGDEGKFQFAPRGSCTTAPLHATPTQQTFLSASMNQAVKNYDGDISDAFKCIALLGDQGCGFEGQLKSVHWALDPLAIPAGNEGFLRADAFLAVILITNEDDCSVPDGSDLVDPTQTRMSDPLGPYWSFRCNEFGHLCNINGVMQPPPRGAADNLQGCVSNETMTGHLTKVGEEITFLKSLKADPTKIFVAAITGLPTSYGIEMIQLPNDREPHPNMKHSCTTTTGEYADPSVRIKQWVDGFGDHGLIETICANDFHDSLGAIAKGVGNVLLKPQCFDDVIVDRDPSAAVEPDCQVTDTQVNDGGKVIETVLHSCASDASLPCWSLDPDTKNCAGGKVLNVTRVPGPLPDTLQTSIACATCIPGVPRDGCP